MIKVQGREGTIAEILIYEGEDIAKWMLMLHKLARKQRCSARGLDEI